VSEACSGVQHNRPKRQERVSSGSGKRERSGSEGSGKAPKQRISVNGAESWNGKDMCEGGYLSHSGRREAGKKSK